MTIRNLTNTNIPKLNFKRNNETNNMSIEYSYDDLEWFQINMIYENNINNIIQIKSETIDNITNLNYDLTQLVPLNYVVRSNNYDLKDLLISLIDIIEGANNYYLDANKFILDIDYMYFDKKSNQLKLIYLPIKSYYSKVNLIDFIKNFVRNNVLLEIKNPDTIFIMNIINKYDSTIVIKKEIKEYIMKKQIGNFENDDFKEKNNINNGKIEYNENQIKKPSNKKIISKKQLEKEISKENKHKLMIGLAIYVLLLLISSMSLYILDKLKLINIFIINIFIVIIFFIVYFVREKIINKNTDSNVKKNIEKFDFEKKSFENKNNDIALNITNDIIDEEEINKNNIISDYGKTILLTDECKLLSFCDLRSGEKHQIEFKEDMFITIGRENINNIWIQDQTIGRIHAKVLKLNGKFFIKDMNSLNGTFLNGHRIDSGINVEIKNGDVVAFAKIKFAINN
ncbi:FHA domain-containing protein [Helicovermis profundi]|uniref:DUF6382 domain-containing protein n=1 Tax=Helicovermis profundi TaxID=3065157 RepID=A0AAU9EQG9_9FIRM|nr:DUF6382 domain-containing protein [Clostridia bacterium S502]